jgi:branched-subunit amino acid ABC-type transport system permease component
MRLSRGHLRWVYASCGLLFASGALWLLFHYFIHAHGEFGDSPHALELWWLRLHGAAAMLVMIVLGSLVPIHVRRGWHQRKNLLAGTILATLALLLIASGYALYYFGSEETRPWISALHWVLGLGAPLLLVWHIVSGRRTRTLTQAVPKYPVDVATGAHDAQDSADVHRSGQGAKQRSADVVG